MQNSFRTHSNTFKTAKIIIIIGFSLVAYMLYALTREIYKNYQIDKHISTFEERNGALAQENLQKIEDLRYYTSDAYIEKKAKESLGLVNPGEEVLILPALGAGQTLEESYAGVNEKTFGWSHFKRWWEFFFVENPYK